MTRRRASAMGRMSMVAGSVLMVVGLSIRGGALGVVAGSGASPSASPTPAAIALDAPPSPTATTEPSPAPTPTVPATPPPAEPLNTIFEDTFEFEGAWPTGELGELGATYEAGRYVIVGPGAELPVFIAPVAEPLASASTLIVEAELTLEPGARAGVYVGGDSERVGALIDSDGRVTIIRDSSVSLDVLGSGSVATSGTVRLTLTVDGATVSVAIDGRQAVSIVLPATAVDFGLVVWPTEQSAVSMARFRVTSPSG